MTNEKRMIIPDELIAEIEILYQKHYVHSYDKTVHDIFNAIRRRIRKCSTLNAIELPCKIGDMVWGIKKFNHETKSVKQGIVHMMFFGEDMRLCICVKGVCRGEWGKNVFATKEEALAKMDGGN